LLFSTARFFKTRRLRTKPGFRFQSKPSHYWILGDGFFWKDSPHLDRLIILKDSLCYIVALLEGQYCNLRYFGCCFLVLFLITYPVDAQTAYEGFDEAPSAPEILNNNAGITSYGWSGNWASTNWPEDTVTGPGMHYTDGLGQSLQTTDGTTTGMTVMQTGFSQRPLASVYNSGTVWISFLANLNADAGDRRAGLALMDGSNERVHIGNQTGGTFWTLQRTGGSTQTTTNLRTADTFAALRIDFASGGGTNLYLFINPNLGAANEPSIASADATLLSVADFQFDGIQIGSNLIVDGVSIFPTFDEIRVGSTFASITDIVPEPSVLGMVLISVLMFGWFALARLKYPVIVKKH
jgi:hypothetical protein